MYGDGEQSRDFVYVGNVVEAILLAAESKDAPGHAYNIGTGIRSTLNQTLTLLRENYRPGRQGEIRSPA